MATILNTNMPLFLVYLLRAALFIKSLFASSICLPPSTLLFASPIYLPPPLPSASESINQTSKNRYLPYAGQLQSQEPTIHPSRRSKILHLPRPAEAISCPASPLSIISAPSHFISGIPQADAALFFLKRHEDNGDCPGGGKLKPERSRGVDLRGARGAVKIFNDFIMDVGK